MPWKQTGSFSDASVVAAADAAAVVTTVAVARNWPQISALSCGDTVKAVGSECKGSWMGMIKSPLGVQLGYSG